MSLRNDFHNGRTYAEDSPEGTGPGLGFNVGLTLAWLKSQLVRLFRSGSPPSDIKPISTDGPNSPYSLLGVSEQDQHPDPSGTPVFPTANWARARAPAARHDRQAKR